MAAPVVIHSSSDSDTTDPRDGQTLALTSSRTSQATKRRRADPPPPPIFARVYQNVEAIKAQLREWNPKCFPRVRSCSGKDGRNVRFACKNEKVNPHNCRLNVSALRENGVLRMSFQTYRPGCCGYLQCCNCGDDLEEGMYTRCDNDFKHAICRTCFNTMVRIHVCYITISPICKTNSQPHRSDIKLQVQVQKKCFVPFAYPKLQSMFAITLST